ncbi:MAG: hypothetical protein GF405_08085 [Candidatus Eisenbacteria bacterium]|nr:hypothetical protein [Candidatus Eisenbacteria bacterium]
MARYQYVAKTTAGIEKSDYVYAESAEAAADMLHRDGLVVLSIRQVGETLKEQLSAQPLFGGRVSSKTIALFTKQLASMLRAGLPLVRALYALAREEENSTFRDVLIAVAGDIEGGESLSAAMAKHQNAFSKLYVGMVRSGESSGTLDSIMDQLVIYLNRTEAIKRKVRAALAYPIFVVSFSLVAMVVLLIRIVPMMAEVYDKLGADLPGPTKVVIGASQFVSSNLWVFVAVVAALVAAYQILGRRDEGRLLIDRIKLRIPIFGRLVRKVVVAKFLRTLGTLVTSGLPMIEALELSGNSSGNEVIRRAGHAIADMVERGSSLSLAFSGSGIFPEIVVQMVATGEETGSLGDMLDSVSDHYDDEVETAVEGLASVIEPLMIVLIGGIIAIMLVAMFLPVFHLGGAVRRGM